MTAGMALLAVQLAAAGARQPASAEPARPSRPVAALEWTRCRSGCCMAGRRWWRCSPACRSPSRWAAWRRCSCSPSCPAASLDTIAQNVYEELASITLLTIPLFILKGAAIGKSRAGKDLYDALHTWLGRVPGGLGVAVVIACGLFAAMAGSSPATCSAIGSSGIPEMRRRGYSPGFAAGLVAAGGTLGILLPPSIVLILYAVAAEQSLGRLFLAGIGPGLLLVVLFAGYAMLRWRRGIRRGDQVRRRRRGARRDPAAGPLHDARALGGAAARAAVPDPADRRHGRALWRHRHAERDGRARRGAGAGPDRDRLRRVAAGRPQADLRRHARRERHAAADHRHEPALQLRDELPAHQPGRRRLDRRAGARQVAAAGGDPAAGRRARLLPAAGLHHPDDRADHPAAAARPPAST